MTGVQTCALPIYMKDQFVPDDVIKSRFAKLKAVTDRSALLRHESREGLLEEVLVEGTSRTKEDRFSGRTRQGKLVHFAHDNAGVRPGSLVEVVITHGAPYHLLGDFVREIRPPRHKTRIPLSVS